MINKNHFRFKKCFNIASTTDEHSFLFELSLGRLFNHVLLCIIEKLLSFKCTYSHYFLFADTLKPFVFYLSPNIFTLKMCSISNSVKDNISFALILDHRNFADVVYAQTATLHTN